jgi:hypothetical protein
MDQYLLSIAYFSELIQLAKLDELEKLTNDSIITEES